MSKFESFLTYLIGKNLLITTHYHTDLDGFVSCIVLQFLFEKIFTNQKTSIYFPEFSKYTKVFLDKFRKRFPEFVFNPIKKKEIINYEVIIVVDTNNLDQVDPIPPKPFIFIDHHLNLNKNYAGNLESLNLIFEGSSSTAEIILELIRFKNIKVPTPYKILLVAAILTDSGFFKYGNNQTILNISNLLEESLSYQEISDLLESDLGYSEKIAKIKGLQRVKLTRMGDWLIGTSKVSSFSASVATMLINVGFDISIVLSVKKDMKVISARANKKVCKETALHLGKILSDVGIGNAGGHDGAASLNGKFDTGVVFKRIMEKIKKILII